MRSSKHLLMMHLGTEVLALGRNILLARLLGPAEMGMVAIFAIGLRILEMGSDCATDRLLIQADDGDDPQLQATAHGLEIIRGAISSIILVALLVPFSILFDQSFATSSYIILGLVPLTRGLVHLDYKRFQRNLQFRAAAWIEIFAALSAILAAAPSVIWLGDYRGVLIVVLVQTSALVWASHWLAERPYRIAFHRELVLRILSFGWPLALNGLLLFSVFQGDRLVVALSCSAADLGRYSICFQLSLIPVLVLSRLISSIFFPLLSRYQGKRSEFLQLFELGNLLVSLIAVWLGLGIAFLAAPTIRLLYGDEFLLGGALFHLLAMMQATRLFRSLVSVAAVARGDSRQPLIVNLFRLSGVLMAIFLAASGMGLIAIAAASCLGELVAAVASIFISRHRLSIPPGLWKLPVTQLSSLILWIMFVGHASDTPFKGFTAALLGVGFGTIQVVCVWRCRKLFQSTTVLDSFLKSNSSHAVLEKVS